MLEIIYMELLKLVHKIDKYHTCQDDELVDENQIMRMLQINPEQMKDLLNNEDIPVFQVGNTFFSTKNSIIKWVCLNLGKTL